jgi:tetratricopeptide (TPR) repeat protein
MAKGNCQFNGTGGQYFGPVFIHLFLISFLTFGLYSAWAWVKIFRLKASHTTVNGKPVIFTGSGIDLFKLILIQGFLTLVTFGLYFPWAICKFFSWRAQNTLVEDKPGQFTGTGGTLFLFNLIHLMILPMLTLGIYYFWGLYRLYAWKEEHTKYGGEKTSFGAGFGEFLKVSFISYVVNIISLSLFAPWAMCMLFRWQVNGLAVGAGEEIEHFPPVKTNIIVVGVMMAIGLSVFFVLGLFIKGQVENVQRMRAEMERMQRMQMAALKRNKTPYAPPSSPRATQKASEKSRSEALPQPAMPPSVMPSEKRSTPEEDIDYESEVKELSDLINRDSKNVRAFYNRAWLHEFNGNLQMAEKDYSWAIGIDGTYTDAYYNRGLVHIRMKNYDQAIEDFSEAIRLNPAAADSYCNRGNANYQAGKNDLALRDYNAALKIDPDDSDLYYNRAIVYLAKGEEAKAMEDFQKAAQMGHDQAGKYLEIRPAKQEISRPPSRASSVSPSMDLNNVGIPDATASGKLHGRDFTVENAKIENGILSLRQGEDFFADNEVMIFLFLKEGETLDGKTYNVSSDHGFGVPHIHMKWRPEGKDLPETEMFMKDYAMRLELGKRGDEVLPGKIYLSLPDDLKSFVAGTFKADIKE